MLRYELPFSTYNIRTRISPGNCKSPSHRMIKQNADLNNQVEIAFSQKCHCGWEMKGLHSSAPQEQTHQGLLQHLLTVFFSGTCNEHVACDKEEILFTGVFCFVLKNGLASPSVEVAVQGRCRGPWPTFAQVCICVAEADVGNASLFACTKAHGKERCSLLPSACFLCLL